MRQRRGDKHEVAARKEGEDSRSKGSRPASSASFLARAFLGIALVVLLALCAGVYAWAVKANTDAVRELRISSDILGGDLESRLSAVRERLDVWATDAQLREALRSGKRDVLQSTEEALASSMPQQASVRLLPAGFDTLGAKTGTLSYAGLDLVRQAQLQRRVTSLEVHRLGQPEVHLAIAGPVLDEKGASVLGVLHVSLPLSWLPTVPSAAAGGGRLAFQQQVDQAVVTLDPARGLAMPDSTPDVAVAVPNTRLRVAGWVSGTSLVGDGILLFASMAYAVALGLIAVVLWLTGRALNRALASDYAAIMALVEDAAAGRPLRQPATRLAEAGPVAAGLTRLLVGFQGVKAASARGATDGVAQVGVVPKESPPAPALAAAETQSEPAVKQQAMGSSPVAVGGVAASEAPPRPPRIDFAEVPATIFRAYDIRGVVGTDLTPDLVYAIGRAIGSRAAEAGDQSVMVARDTRPSGQELSRALLDGLRASGRDVVDLGVAPTPLLYFATCYQGSASGVMVTASHNPEEYNGLKVVIRGRALEGDGIRDLRDRIRSGRFTQGEGSLQEADLALAYIDRIEKDVAVAYTMKLVVDCGNGAASTLAPRLYRGLGCEVVECDCDPQAGFPGGRVPDPSRPDCLEALRRRVVEEQADLGLAFDADGDRLGVVDSSGKIIWTDRVLMLLAADVLSRHPGTDVVFDVKSTHHLASQILSSGGRPVMWRSGHSPLKAKLQETGGLLAGEWSGHIIFRERWYGFDDAIYAGARLLEVLALDPRPTAEVFAALPEALATPELFLPLPEAEPARIMEKVMQYADRLDGVGVQTIDGLRADSHRGWGLVRASNTQPALVFRFEGDDEAALTEIQELFRRLMARAAPDLALPF
jgi:phosphomannomutase/phosphoglucomutase